LNVNEYIQSGAIEACIFGVATTEEQLQYQTMRIQHAEVVNYANACEEELEASMLQNANAVPSANAKQIVMDQINTTTINNEAKVVAMPTTKRKSSILQYAIAACLAIALGSIVFTITMANKIKQQQATINDLNKKYSAENMDFLKDATITPIALNGVGYHAVCRCSLFWDKNKSQVYIQIHHLFDMGKDKEYQLWGTVNGKVVSLGLFGFDASKKPITLKNIPEGITEFTVTVENKGGATKPNEDILLKGVVNT
jgi:hypothetical protein